MKLYSIAKMPEDAPFFQSEFWASFKELGNWSAYRFQGSYEEKDFSLLLLSRKVGFLHFAYSPYGPCIQLPQTQWQKFLVSLSRELQAFLPLSHFFVRYDLPWIIKERNHLSWPLRQAEVRIQPRATQLLHLEDDLELILQNMHKKWRYNIRLSKKNGVQVIVDNSKVKEWYNLYQITAQRNSIGIHQLSYYEQLFRRASTTEKLKLELLLAWHQEKILAGIIVAYYGSQAIYLYGASANEGREHMPNYLLQWEAISRAKNYGAKKYDFFGIPENPDDKDSMKGLYRFKTGFGGEKQLYLGVCDYPYSQILYTLFRGCEQFKNLYHRWSKKR